MLNFLRSKLRMAQWLALAVLFYMAAFAISIYRLDNPAFAIPTVAIDTVLWKLGNITSAAYVAYWIDRRAFYTKRISGSSPELRDIRRAIIISAAMIAVGLGL
jgi:hypothetical protein